ncbi:MAG: hypothetical protein NZ805_02700 [Armatimonadetes bacterium]|nr:hypothetical protein [Armatimonadota bacterium]MDW8028795.1 hypothetical protein [Armatimonadota bacterium]
MQAEFVRRLIHRRKLFPSWMASVLQDLRELREIADYEPTNVSRSQAQRATKLASDFLEAIEQTLTEVKDL